jgi:outer membrane protein assembly factor BamB
MHGKNSHASPTPIIANEKIYVHFGYQGTACLSLDGDIEWVNRDLYFPPTHGNGGSPVLVEEMLIFTCDGGEDPKVVALDRATGQLAWEVARKADAKKTFSFCTPSVISVKGQTLVITPGSDKVMAIDPRTGEVVWSFRYTGYSVVPKPIYIDGLVVISTGFDEAKMLAINPVGVGDITETNLVWELDRNVPKTPSMIAHNGLIYSISDDGIALCVQANSGEVQYRKRIGGNYSASPILAGGNLYFTSEQGRTTVIREGADFEIISECDLEERTLATMALWKNSFLFRTDNALYHISN